MVIDLDGSEGTSLMSGFATNLSVSVIKSDNVLILDDGIVMDGEFQSRHRRNKIFVWKSVHSSCIEIIVFNLTCTSQV